MQELTEDLALMRNKLKTWRETGVKPTTEIVKKLKDGLSIEQIKTTKISKVVARISNETGNSEEEKSLITLCIETVQFWKEKYRKFKEEEKKKEKEPIKVITPQIKPSVPDEKKKKKPAQNEKIQKPIQNETEKYSEENNSLFPTDQNREKICKILLNIMEIEVKKQNGVVPDEKIAKLVASIERELLKKHKEVNKRYNEDCRILFANLKDPKNPELCQKVLNGEITPANFVSCDPKILISEKSAMNEKKIITNSVESVNLNWEKESILKNAVGGGAICINPKCRSDKTRTVTAQIRRADEGMTEFHDCLVCGKTWKH